MENGLFTAIEQAGGQQKVADLLGLSRQQVNAWAKGRERVPLRHVQRLEALAGIRREVLRPDIYTFATSDF